MKAFFARLPARPQLFLVSGSALLLLLAASGFSWQVHSQHAEARIALAESMANLQALNDLVISYSALQAERGAGSADGEASSLTAVVDQSLQGKSFQPSRIQQSAPGELQLRLDNVPFNETLAWLVELENTGMVRLSTLGVSQGQEGRVSITLVLSGA